MHLSHSSNQDSRGPCPHGLTELQGFSYSNAYLCDNDHHPQRSSLLWTHDYVKNHVQKRLDHPTPEYNVVRIVAHRLTEEVALHEKELTLE